jgi:hypothetical protein
MKIKSLVDLQNYYPSAGKCVPERVIEGHTYNAEPATNLPYEGAVWITKFSKGQGLFLFKDQYELVGE